MNINKLKINTSKNYFHEILKYGFVGILNTIVGYGTYFILIKFNMYYILSSIISQIIGMTHSYVWNKYFTFRSNQKSLMEIIKFISVALSTYFINLFLLMVLVEVYHIDKAFSGFLSISIVTFISFLGHKFISFRK